MNMFFVLQYQLFNQKLICRKKINKYIYLIRIHICFHLLLIKEKLQVHQRAVANLLL